MFGKSKNEKKIQTHGSFENAGPLARLTVHSAARARWMTIDAEDPFQSSFSVFWARRRSQRLLLVDFLTEFAQDEEKPQSTTSLETNTKIEISRGIVI
jgi:hypothetical protein